MPKQVDLEKIIADNPSVDPEELRKAEEALKSLNRTGVVRRSTYGLETPESKKEIRHSEETAGSAMPFRRLR
ncbi:MAG: hypothetical protein ABSD63_17715 [Candidatus Korobacteraceae bacterium]|jgi:hypothetical protein